ncbi:MAG: bifunctional glutamate N-acetyltransferase/amino-acid acetyltransferase ArgJ [Anaerolineae bacterium]|nr:bifunctional glutamate N-acetyltransferase/amino-acid acetyltransferase ArgJ [Anaerolineae bacterium]
MESISSQSPPIIPGFRAAGVACGLKKTGAPDLALIAADGPCTAAGVFTTNQVKAAPVLYDQDILRGNVKGIRAVVINSGGANACTGPQGLTDARHTARLAAAALGCPSDAVLVMSTGVIGQPLKMDRIEDGIRLAVPALAPDGWEAAAQAIMTTDTRRKLHVQWAIVDKRSLGCLGIAKGAGMIHPNMATMLSLIVTNAAVAPTTLRRALHEAVQDTFNAITVDGDTSTNDTLLVLANGRGPRILYGGVPYATLVESLRQTCLALALAITEDGEGASKMISILVRGAPFKAAARQVAKAIAHSPLVKTAIYGQDANWGRILAAAGYSGVAIDLDHLSLWLGRGRHAPGWVPQKAGADVVPETDARGLEPLQVHLVREGRPYDVDEARAAQVLSGHDVAITLDLGLGPASAVVWTCDLTHDYVTINGRYRT